MLAALFSFGLEAQQVNMDLFLNPESQEYRTGSNEWQNHRHRCNP